MAAAIRDAGSDPSVSVLVLRFDATPIDVASGWSGLVDAVVEVPKPVVAVIDGHLDGVGLLVACLADLRVVTLRSTLSGISPGLSGDAARRLSALLAGMVGTGRLPEVLTSPALTPNRAVEIGLANHVSDLPMAVTWALETAAPLADEQRFLVVRAAKKAALGPIAAPTPASHQRVHPRPANGDMKHRILDAAAAVLAREGYRNCRLADIASAIGAHQTTIYHYFDSKDALVQAVLQNGLGHAYGVMTTAVESLSKDANPLDRIAAAMRAHLEVTLGASDFSAAAMRLQSELSPRLLEGLRAIQREYGAYWSELFRQARDAGLIRADVDLSVARSFVAGALNSAIEWYDPNKLSVEQIADEFVTVALSGLASPEAHARGLVAGLGRSADPQPHQPEEYR